MAYSIAWRLSSGIVWGLLCCLCLNSSARALGEADPEALFARGVQAADAERWKDAEAAFAAVCQTAPTANALLNLATARYHRGKAQAALDALDRLDALPLASEDQRATAQQMREHVEKLLATLSVLVEPPEAEVRLDGSVLPLDARQRRVDPGLHVVEAHADGYEDGETRVEVAPGERSRVQLSLARLAPAPVAGAAPPSAAVVTSVPSPPAEPRDDEETKRRRWLWAVGTVVLAGAAVAVGMTVGGGRTAPCIAGSVEGGLGGCAP